MKKLFILGLTLITSLVGCDKTSSKSGKNPFDSRFEVSKEQASTIINTWMNNLDRTTSYIAHYSYAVIEHTSKEAKYNYVADYNGVFVEETFEDTGYEAYYSFRYIDGSVDESKSNMEPHPYINSGRGLALIKNTFKENDEHITYKYYYYSDEYFGVYASYALDDYSGYLILKTNKNGLVSYEEQYESEGSMYWKQIEKTTFELK